MRSIQLRLAAGFLICAVIGGVTYTLLTPAPVANPEADSGKQRGETLSSREGPPQDATTFFQAFDSEPNTKPSEETTTPSGILQELSQERSPSATLSMTASEQRVESLRLGDQMLLGGNVPGAIRMYKEVGQSDPGTIQLRLAIASEAGQLWKRAEEHYRAALQYYPDKTVGQLQSLLGIARIWENAASYDDAIQLLSEVSIRFDHARFPEVVTIALQHQLTQCLQKKVLAEAPQQDWKSPIYFWASPSIASILASVDEAQFIPQGSEQEQAEISDARSANPHSPFSLVQRPGTDVNLILVESRATQASVLSLLKQVLSVSGFELSITNPAHAKLAGRHLQVETAPIPVANLLDRLLFPLGLTWEQVDAVVMVQAMQPGPRENQFIDSQPAATQSAATRDVIRRATEQLLLLELSADERTIALLNQANMNYANNDARQAEIRYGDALASGPTGELAATIFYDKACLQESFGASELALQSFYNALDQSLQPSLQALCYTRIAELELLLGRPDVAASAAMRGLRISEQSATSALCIQLLVKSHLLAEAPYQANQVVFEYADQLSDESSRRLCTLFSTLARHQVLENTSGLSDEGERLLRAIAGIQPGDVVSSIDHILMARAYQSVGLWSEAIEELQAAESQNTQEYWGTRIAVTQARLYVELAEYAKSQSLLDSVRPPQNTNQENECDILKMRLLAKTNQPEQCIALCHSLLQRPLTNSQQKTVLLTLGQSHAAVGQNYAAALAFSGILPTDGGPASKDSNVSYTSTSEQSALTLPPSASSTQENP